MSVLIVSLVDAANGDVLSCSHLEAHEVLKDHTDLAVQVFERVLTQIHTVEQNLSLGWVVEPCDQLHHGGLALAVLADQRDALSQERGLD